MKTLTMKKATNADAITHTVMSRIKRIVVVIRKLELGGVGILEGREGAEGQYRLSGCHGPGEGWNRPGDGAVVFQGHGGGRNGGRSFPRRLGHRAGVDAAREGRGSPTAYDAGGEHKNEQLLDHVNHVTSPLAK